MSEYVDCNGVPLKIGDMCMVVRHNPRSGAGDSRGKIIVVKYLYISEKGNAMARHEVIRGTITAGTQTTYLKKLQDLDDEDLTKNNILFSHATNNWERITDYPTKPKLEPELEPSKV